MQVDRSLPIPVGDSLSDDLQGFALPLVPLVPGRSWAGVPDVVSRADIVGYAAQLLEEAKGRQSADALLARAEVEASAVLKRARQQARTLGDSQLKLWQEAFDVRQGELSEALGSAVTVVVQSVLKSLLGSSPDLPVQASIELAMRVLNSELRAAVLCHPLDLPLVQAQAGRLGTLRFNPDAEMPRGQIVFSSDEGEVRVDGQKVIDRLVADLRQVLSAKVLPVPT
jgi:hypothetical protein